MCVCVVLRLIPTAPARDTCEGLAEAVTYHTSKCGNHICCQELQRFLTLVNIYASFCVCVFANVCQVYLKSSDSSDFPVALEAGVETVVARVTVTEGVTVGTDRMVQIGKPRGQDYTVYGKSDVTSS